MREREVTLQIRPVELICDASHELPKHMLGPELFLDVPGKKGTYLAGRALPSVIGWLASVTVGPLFPQCPSKISVYGRLLLFFPSLFPLSRHESLSQGLFPPPGRLVIYSVPRVNPRNNPFFASGTYC